MPHTVWVANGKGGVGKSVLMMALAAIYEASGRPLRLIDADDKALVKKFADANPSAMAEDRDGALVFLARNAWTLSRAQQDFPGLRFNATREQH